MFVIKKRNLLIAILVAALLGGAVSCGTFLFLDSRSGAVRISKQEYEILLKEQEKYGKLEQLYQVIDESYYKPIPDEDLMLGIYRGLFAGIGDKYSTYMTAEEYESAMVNSSSEFEGVGITFSYDMDDNLIVLNTIEDSPAEAAGIRAGDILQKIDGVHYDGAQLSTAASALRGKAGTSVKVNVLRDGEAKDIVLVRATIVKQTVSSKILPDNIGYIKITTFESATAEVFEKELRSMEMKGVKGLIIDLRNNGGGLVDQGLKIADMLLPEGVITYLEDKNGNRKYENSDAMTTKLPYVIIVNGGTASTSEILGAAVKDSGEGSLVGTKTYGKGIVQSVLKLRDGDAVKLTTMQYFSPKGAVIHEKGIEPNYVVNQIEGDPRDYQLEKAKELLS